MFRILTILSLLLAGLYQPCCGCCHATAEQTEGLDSTVSCPRCAKNGSDNTPQRKCPCQRRTQSQFSNVIVEQDLVPGENGTFANVATEIPATLPTILSKHADLESASLRSVSLTVLHCRYQC